MDDSKRLREVALAARRRPGMKIQLELKPDNPEDWERALVALQNVADMLKTFGPTNLKIIEEAEP